MEWHEEEMASHITIPDMHVHREPHILVASTGLVDERLTNSLLPQLAAIPDCSIRAIIDQTFQSKDYIDATKSCQTSPNTNKSACDNNSGVTDIESEAVGLCQWADLLVLAPIDANNLAKMLHGETDNLLLEILRSWNVSKKIIMVPGMSANMWENPMTKKQLTKIRRKWNFVQVLQPVLWTFESDRKVVSSWKALSEVLEMVRNQIDLMNIGQGVVCSPVQGNAYHRRTTSGRSTSKSKLPPELWTMILDFTNDWELAQRLQIYTNLPPPSDWTRHTSSKGPETYTEKLEWQLLTSSPDIVKSFLSSHPEQLPRCLSRLSTRMIMRFAPVSLLSYFESELPDLFWATFGNTFLPDKASSVFGRVEILEWWHTSPSFLTKKYTAEALDGASRQGFLNVLEWWQRSGLPLHFTEAALEQASSQGHVDVLEWWKQLAIIPDTSEDTDTSTDTTLVLKPGKSICYATQAGHAAAVRWWLDSGIAFQHEDVVPKLASTYGHVSVLQVWHDAKGSKMTFDNQVLVGATKLGHVAVLEWWKRSGLRVEYKTCDVEEALEDGVEGKKGEEVKRWWAKNGLNLGVGTSEWMRSKVL
ncbi:flavo protein [Myriangium duriaei CBS 260.36]|uniref:Flavo protein n=1 Tax=Myriangium duriaei CBS 260.36 TaxID=1168546 RepID=A0A9P4IX81_9PEZI|nr:flavo protein [Myriangium duriaei CBS 260.36]